MNHIFEGYLMRKVLTSALWTFLTTCTNRKISSNENFDGGEKLGVHM